MSTPANHDRRRFLRSAGMAIVASQLDLSRLAGASFFNEGSLPSLDGATGWLNSQPLKKADLHGRVTLIDFWTYTCINWRRTLPYIRRFPSESSREAADKALRLQLILADGSTYVHEGRFSFADREINPGTGAIRIAALFPNPDNIRRPGGYGKVRAVIRKQPGALLVPQRAVSELQGSYQVAVVDNDNRVAIRSVQIGDAFGLERIVTGGLNPGERVVAEGIQKVRQGMQVNPVPFNGTSGR